MAVKAKATKQSAARKKHTDPAIEEAIAKYEAAMNKRTDMSKEAREKAIEAYTQQMEKRASATRSTAKT